MQGIISSVGNLSNGSSSMNYLPATPIVPYLALVDAPTTLNSNLFTGSTNNSIYGNDDGGNLVNVSSTTFGAGDLRSLLTNFLDISSATDTYNTMDVNTGNKYITQIDISRESGTSLTATIQWYHSDTYVSEESVTIASGSSHIFTPPDTVCNIAKIVLTKGTTAVYRCRIRVAAKLTCQANNIDIPGVMYAILPEFPLPSSGKNKIRSINSNYYANYSTNYSAGLYLISYNGSIIDYHT